MSRSTVHRATRMPCLRSCRHTLRTPYQLVFPSGATLTFRHFDDASAEANFQGSQYHFIGVDEATDFTEDQVLFLSSRLRKAPTDPLPLRLRLTAYPYGPGKEWVHRRYVIEAAAAAGSSWSQGSRTTPTSTPPPTTSGSGPGIGPMKDGG